MQFKNVDMEPAVIFDANDPQHLQRVKCAIAGVYDPTTMDKEIIPWIMPANMNRHQSFSKPVEGNKVWVIKNNDNYNECYYIFMHEYDAAAQSFVDSKYDKDAEIIFSRVNGGDSSQMTYDTDDGIVEHVGEYKQQIKSDGTILHHGGSGDLDIRDGHVFTGSNDGDYEPGVLGDKLVELFKDLGNKLMSAGAKVSACPGLGANGATSGPDLIEAGNICAGASKILCKVLKVN